MKRVLQLLPALRTAILVAATGVALAGCTVVPGLNLSEKDVKNDGTYRVVKSQDHPGYEVVKGQHGPITPDVVEITPDLVLTERLQSRGPLEGELKPVRPDEKLPEYRIGPRDVLSVTVWEHPELTNPSGASSTDPMASGRLVAADGTIFYPYVGVLPVAGKTVLDVRNEITEALKKVIKDPQVDVRILAYRAQRVQVFGEVAHPGIVTLDDTPKGVVEAISETGGLTSAASRRRVFLQRHGVNYEIDLSALLSGPKTEINPQLEAGDVLRVPDRAADQVFMLGEVSTQRPLYLEEDEMSLTEALTQAGGLDKLRAADSGVLVFRRGLNGAKPKVFVLKMSKPQGLLLAGEFRLEPRDVVYVKTADFAQYAELVNALLPSVTAIYEIDILGR